MGFRPARTCRDTDKPSWSRYSKKKPKKSFVRSRPHNPLMHFDMGKKKDDYDTTVMLVARDSVQLRANALESARIVTNRHLQTTTQQNYMFKIHVYPFEIIRETKRHTGAGADRISSGMQAAFGKPTYRAVRLKKKQVLFSIKTYKKYILSAKQALKKAQSKLSKNYRIVVKQKQGASQQV